MRSAALKRASQRIAWLRALLLVLFLVLSARAAHLAVLETRSSNRGDRQIRTIMELPPTRGLIVDRNGVELALTLRAPSVYVMAHELRENPAVLRKLANALKMKRERLAARLDGRSGFTFVKRWVSEKTAGQIEKLDLPGVGIVREPRRAYPADELAASILGFANIDGVGVRGIEQMEDEWLKGRRLRTPVERDARGRLLALTTVTPRDAAGGDIALTLDASMQASAEASLRKAIRKSGARGGCVISLDPRTGEILALAEAPSFNPNHFRNTDYQATRSPAFVDAVEPGSTFKAFLIAAALEAGAIDRTEVIDTGDGTMRIPGKTIRDLHPAGVIDPAGVLMHSSNVGAVQIAQRLGAEPYFDALRRFGFGARTKSGFPSESPGLLRAARFWKPVDQATIAFGQGVSVTPIQLASAMSVLASGGEWRQPRLISARRRPKGEWQDALPTKPRRVISKKNADAVLEMLEGVVSGDGTGRLAGLAGVRVSGKTGTAQKLDVERGRYSRDRYLAWFMGAAPAEDPRLVVVALLDEPKGLANGGGDVAAPLFAQVAALQLAHFGIITHPQPIPRNRRTRLAQQPEPAPAAVSAAPPAKKTAKTAKKVTPMQAPTAPAVVERRAVVARATPASTAQSASIDAAVPVFMPDFRGETITSARQLAARDALEIEVLGTGLAIRQDPSPGTVVVGGTKKVRVYFSVSSQEG